MTAGNGLRFDIPGTSLLTAANPTAASSWYRIVWDNTLYFVTNKKSYLPVQPSTNYALEKPHTSLYVHATFALESMFLWKIANKRLDGRTDAQYPLDIDFGANHPTSITEDEIRIIRDWIDAGAFAKQ